MEINQFLKEMIIQAHKQEVSDIHFHPLERSVRVYYRFQNELQLTQEIDLEDYIKLLRFIKFKTRLDITVTRYPQDGSYKIDLSNDKQIFVRVSTIPLVDNESLVIRLLTDQITTYKNKYNESELEQIYDTINSKNGLFIFTGPTGSGKTTIMYEILDQIVSNEHKKVITIENPIEIINEQFVQMQINEAMNINYATALKSVLRQDPDVIMIGEIRDQETANNVIRAALTGHTVISTMHTKNKYGVIERFLDFGFNLSEIKSVLTGISNQRLVHHQGEIINYLDIAVGNGIEKLINQDKEVAIEEKIQKFIKEIEK